MSVLPVVSKEIEAQLKLLLTEWQKSIYAEIAYNRFFGLEDEGPALYSDPDLEYNLQIIEATLGNSEYPEGIRSANQAQDALGDLSNYKRNRTKFRQMGLLYGIDAEHFGPYRLDARKYGFFDDQQELSDEGIDDLVYNTEIPYKKQDLKPNQLKYAFTQPTDAATETRLTTSDVATDSQHFRDFDRGYRTPTPWQFFGTPAMLQHLANQGFILNDAIAAIDREATAAAAPAEPEEQPVTATAPAASTTAGPTKVLFIGDSQWSGAGALRSQVPAALEAVAPGQFIVETLAQRGNGLRDTYKVFEIDKTENFTRPEGRRGGHPAGAGSMIRPKLASFEPSVVVIALGGNDAWWAVAEKTAPPGGYVSIASRKQSYQALMAHWVNVIKTNHPSVQEIRFFGPSWANNDKEPHGKRDYKHYQTGVRGTNNQIYDPVRQVVRDWQKEAAASLDATWYDMVPYTNNLPGKTSDGVHHTGADYTRWAEALVQPGEALDPANLGTGVVQPVEVVQPEPEPAAAPAYFNPYLSLAKVMATRIEEAIREQVAAHQKTPVEEMPTEVVDLGVTGGTAAHYFYQAAAERMKKVKEHIVAMIANAALPPDLPFDGPLKVAEDLPAALSNQDPESARYKHNTSLLWYLNSYNPYTRVEVKRMIDRAFMHDHYFANERKHIAAIVDLNLEVLEEEVEEGIQSEIRSILAFFGVGTDEDPLPDRPEFTTLDAALKDEAARQALTEALESHTQNLTPWDMQCYLMENIEEITAVRTDKRSAFYPTYNHLFQMKTKEPATVVNTLTHGTPGSKKSKRVEALLNLCPDLHGLLEPYIKIYRVDYDEFNNLIIDAETNKPVENELVIPNFMSHDDVSSILSSERGRVPGAGIKSFSWGLDGIQPAEVDNNISATLVIYFQSINDFFRGATQAGADEPNFLDLLINSPAVREIREKSAKSQAAKVTYCGAEKQKHREYKGESYRIKVVAGWSVPDINLSDFDYPITFSEQDLREALRSTQVSLFLQVVRHNLDFKEDGALELSIDYQASLAGALTSPRADIFAEDSEELKTEAKKLDKQIEKYEGRDLNAAQRDAKKELLEERKAINSRGKMRKYKKLLDGFFTQAAKGGKMHTLEINAAEFLMAPYRDLSPQQRAARAKRRLNPATGKLKFSQSGADSYVLQQMLASSPSPEEAAELYSKSETERYNAIQGMTTAFKFLPFFFLGDLIDNVLGQMKKNNGDNTINFDLFLTDVEMVNPLVAFQLADLERATRCVDLQDMNFMAKLIEMDPETFSNANKIFNLMNIGDIPVSVDAFQLFFKNRVVKKSKPRYYFLHFIKDLCAYLITRALNKSCFGVDLSFQQRFDALPQNWRLSHRAAAKIDKPGIRAHRLGALAPLFDPSPNTPVDITRQALVLMPTDSKPSNLVGNYAEDTARGIYHQYIGASCGLLKTLKFQREDQEMLREAKIQREGALSAEQLRELYSADLELVGNNLYKNGMYIYINPTLLDADANQLNYLGIHGYYLVTSVRSTITPDGFNTSLKALHQGIEFKKSEANDYELYDVPPEHPPPDASGIARVVRSGNAANSPTNTQVTEPTSAGAAAQAGLAPRAS